MFKQAIFVTTSISALLTVSAAFAIAPGTKHLATCGNFASNKYKVSPGDVKASVHNQNRNGYFIDWEVRRYRASGYCFVTDAMRVTQFVVERGPKPDQVNPIVGPNEKLFYGLPGYGDVVVNRGQRAQGDRQYFLVRRLSSGSTYTWYARCANNSDQVYDHTGKYVGFDQRMSVMFPYVCEVSPLSRPPVRPEPR